MKSVCLAPLLTALLVFAVTFSTSPAPAAENLIQDPGFENYVGPDGNGVYSPGPGSPWTEYGWGTQGVRNNRNTWTAPQELVDEGGLGSFTPGCGTFEGQNLPADRGTIAWRQSVTTGIQGNRTYDAYLWFAGAGQDLPPGGNDRDQLEETCGFTLEFFSDAGLTNLLASHGTDKNFWGNPQEFVRLSLRGTTPPGAVAMRVTIVAANHGHRVTNFPPDAATRVAVDNMFFGYLDEPNKLVNPKFESSIVTPNGQGFPDPGPWQNVDWVGWITPSTLPGLEPDGFDPQYASQLPYRTSMDEYGPAPDVGDISMCYIGEYTWGGISYYNGAYSMTQFVDWAGEETALVSFYWILDANDSAAVQGNAQLYLAVESRANDQRLGDLAWYQFNWPRPALPNVDRDDSNVGPHHMRVQVPIEPNADEVGLHVRVIHLDPGSVALRLAVDDFYLAPYEAERPPDIDGDRVPDAVEANPPVPGQTNILLHDSDGDGLSDGVEDANRNGVRDTGETDARARDTDGDGLIDGIEVFGGTDPLDPNSPSSYTDGDSDGLPLLYDSNDANPDTDGDGFKDGYEVAVLGDGAAEDDTLYPPLGDVNVDTFVSNVDALISQALFLGNITYENPIFLGTGFRNTDPSRDGFISNLDALLIQSFFLGNLPMLPL